MNEINENLFQEIVDEAKERQKNALENGYPTLLLEVIDDVISDWADQLMMYARVCDVSKYE